MKKLLSMLAIALVLCIACAGLAFAEETPAAETKHEHAYGVSQDESKVIVWPGEDEATGLIRFVCNNAGEYQTEAEAAADFQEYVVYPTDHVFPADSDPDTKQLDMTLADALAKKDTALCVGYLAPTCTEPGSITIKCDHTEELKYDNVKFTGWKGACSATQTYVIAPLGHTWGSEQEPKQYYHIKPATCAEEGEIQDYCLVCGERRGEIIKLDKTEKHVAGEMKVTDATCTTPGKKEQYCEVCGKLLFEEEIPVDVTAHQFGDWQTESRVEPTCTTDGTWVKYRLCWICNKAKEVETETLPALGHDEDNKVLKEHVAPTCKEEGYNTYTCPRCNEEIDEWKEPLPVDPDAHPAEYVEETGKTDPTCEADGVINYKCNLCGATWTKTIPMTGHRWDDGVRTEGYCVKDGEAVKGYITYTCLNDPSHTKVDYDKEAPDHDWGEWVCRNTYNENGETPAYWIRQCFKCGQHDEMILNNDSNPNDACFGGHTPGEVVIENEVEATCEEDGSYEEVVYCTKCDEELSRETVVVPAAGHVPGEAVVENVVEATVEADGSYEEVVYCTVCGNELSRTLITVEAIKDGIVEEDGYLHVYEDGEPSTKSGLTNVNGEWYYLAAGYVDTEFTGLAPFAGNWWTVENGKLINRDANGLVEFQGQMYAISEGMVWTNWDGIHWLNDEEAYLLARGAWQSDYSGVYPEEGNLILIKDGKVDHDATTATVDGKVYKCVNGIVQVR